MDHRAEMTIELRRARGWILGTGLAMFGFNAIWLFAVYGDRYPGDVKLRALLYLLGILGFFVAMWLLARVRPVLACALALGGFWGLYAYLAVHDGDSVFQGIVLKLLFTFALLRGLYSARRAVKLERQLAELFS